MRPNIILITTDQQRGDCLGCDGHPVIETPYLDELAEDGARFPRSFTIVINRWIQSLNHGLKADDNVILQGLG